MNQRSALCLAILIGLTANAQTVVNLGGVVSNKTGQPVANAIVTLARQTMKDTTGTDGKYLFAKNTAVQLPAIVPKTEEISIANGVLQFTLSNSSPVKVEIFDVKGNLLKKEVVKSATAGAYRFNIDKNCPATNLLVIKAAIGKREVSFPYMTLSSGKYSLNTSGAYASPIGGGLAQMAAILDTLKVSATGFQTKTVTITSYDNQQQNISLDSSSVSSDTGRSAGCGKALSAIKSGTYTITSAGLSRQYIIDIPASYDMNHPYRLIFGMHCFGSNMNGVANDKYYQLKRFADSAKNYCIFVAPNGVVTDGNAMWNQAEKDHTFFDDMLKLFTENLCVDTARVFSCGFSYGAMFTYSLSLTHQKVLRAVACYAPANWNIYLPTNTHEPIAFMSTTGISDPNCPFVYKEAEKQGGKYCVLTHAEDNECTIPATIPTAAIGSKTHTCYEFQGGKAGYPVKFCSFDGAHQAGPMDGVSGDNSSKSWIPGETWKFFTQF
jgi:poly(3-hydroxybutyrate) depolymerase